jgi:hypothetical protein
LNTLSKLKFTLAILFFFALAISSQASAGDPPENRYVKVALALVDSSISPGSHGDILIMLTPVDGIHINAEPAPEFLIDSGGVAVAVGKVQMKTERNAKVAAGKPMVQEFAITPKTLPGEHAVRGTFTYYYCSDSEGWCMRYRQAVALTVIVKN